MDLTWPARHMSHAQMIAIPLIFAALMAAAILALGVPEGIEFRGGTIMGVRGIGEKPDAGEIERALESALGADASVRIIGDREPWGVDAEVAKGLGGEEIELAKETLRGLGISGEYDIRSVGPTVLAYFRDQAKQAFIWAFIGAGAIMLVAFRSKAIGLILACLSLDILGMLGGMAILRVPLSLASFAAILMIIGYSVDTNILLTTRMLKRIGGEPRDRLAGAMRTGLMMTGTSIAVLVALKLFTTAPAIDELSSALIFGLLADMINTWLLNGGVLLRRAERMRMEEYYGGI